TRSHQFYECRYHPPADVSI
ncbi:putative membrane protein, partial [Vibrio parahaemolyticus VP2007-007]